MIDNLTKQNIAQALWLESFNEAFIPADILKKIYSQKNSNEAFATRLGVRLDELSETRISYLKDLRKRYETMKEYADQRSAQQVYANLMFMGPQGVRGYKLLDPDMKFEWPQIDHPQWEYQVGWHFFVGNFTDEDNNHYSVQLMYWQYSLLPPDMAHELGLSDIENQILEMHLAISDPQTDTHYRANTVIVAGTTGLIGFKAKPYEYTMGKNVIRSLDPDGNLFPVELIAKGWDMGKPGNPDIEINIFLYNPTGYFMEGDEGKAPCVDGIGTYYYSAANLKLIDTRESMIMIKGEKIKLIDGNMWYDHQWGTGFMPSGAPQHAVMRAVENITEPPPGGWDWFMMHFYENDAISTEGEVQMGISALHTNDNLSFYWQTGSEAPGIMTTPCSGKYIDANNHAIDIKGTMKVTKWVKNSTSPNPDVYLPTHTWYPAEYTFTIDSDVPEPLKQFTSTPITSNAQTGFFANGLQYAEGGTLLTDTLGNEIGRGFAEATNYANTWENVLKLSGMPVNEKTKEFIGAAKPSIYLKITSMLYVAFHKKELEKIIRESRGL
ncbi:MAG: hypothetical protein KAQ69_03495 [Spirochaetales bacterium]|nr:hypothetical protein [Spirochaetales bacterium]